MALVNPMFMLTRTNREMPVPVGFMTKQANAYHRIIGKGFHGVRRNCWPVNVASRL